MRKPTKYLQGNLIKEDFPLRKQLILKEAAQLFCEIGYMASNLRELAKRSGIQGGSLYYYFSSKQEILFTIMDHTMTELIGYVAEGIGGQTDPAKKLRVIIKRHIEFHLNCLNETYVSDNELKSLTAENFEVIVAKRDAYEKIVRGVITEGIDKGIFQTENTKVIAFGILQICTGTSTWFKSDGPLTAERIGYIYSDFILKAILKEK